MNCFFIIARVNTVAVVSAFLSFTLKIAIIHVPNLRAENLELQYWTLEKHMGPLMSIYLAVHPIYLSICRRGDDAPTHEWTYKGIELPKNSGRVYARALASTYELILDQRGLNISWIKGLIFGWGTKVYVQNRLKTSSGILHCYHLTRGSTLTSHNYNPSSVAYLCTRTN